MIEKFGFNQTPLSEEDWIKIGNQMKSSPNVKFKIQRYIAEAQHQSRRFQNLSYITGGVLFLAFLKFPMVRVLPGFQRVGTSAVLAYPFYWYMSGLATRLKLKRIKYAYRKNVVDHNAHPGITM